MMMLLLTVLQLAALLQPAITWRCGPNSVCDCVDDFWILCDNIDSTPNFRMNVRRRHGITLTISNEVDFEFDSLRLTEGFHMTVVRTIGMPWGYCDEVTTDYPWITCQALSVTVTPHENEQTEELTTERETNTDDDATTTSTEHLSVTFEASVSFELKNSVTTSDPGNKTTAKALLDVIKKSPGLFWSCAVLGLVLLTLITVMTIIFVLKKTGDPDATVAAKFCACLCRFCLCPCKCIDKIRARERPYNRNHNLPLHHLEEDIASSESVEVFTQ